MAQAALIGLIGLSAAGSIYSGISAKQSADNQADQLAQQAQIAQQEAQAKADQQAIDRRKFIAEQKVAYLANGVGLSGAPLVTFQDTYNSYQKQIDATIRAGNAQAHYYSSEADTTRKNGRAALISGVTSAAGTVASGYLTGKAAKVF